MKSTVRGLDNLEQDMNRLHMVYTKPCNFYYPGHSHSRSRVPAKMTTRGNITQKETQKQGYCTLLHSAVAKWRGKAVCTVGRQLVLSSTHAHKMTLCLEKAAVAALPPVYLLRASPPLAQKGADNNSDILHTHVHTVHCDNAVFRHATASRSKKPAC